MAEERRRDKGKKRAEKLNQKIEKPMVYEIGEEVLLWANNVSGGDAKRIAKFFDVYEGPCKVESKVAENTYLLVYIETGVKRCVFNARLLKRYTRHKT